MPGAPVGAFSSPEYRVGSYDNSSSFKSQPDSQALNSSEPSPTSSKSQKKRRKPTYDEVVQGDGWVKTSHKIRTNRHAYYPQAPRGKWVEFCKTRHPETGEVPEIDFETIENPDSNEGGWVKVFHGFGALVFHDHAPELFASVPAHTRVVADWDYGIPVKIYETHRTTKDEVQKMQIGKSTGLAVGAGIIAGVTASKIKPLIPTEKELQQRRRIEEEKRRIEFERLKFGN